MSNYIDPNDSSIKLLAGNYSSQDGENYMQQHNTESISPNFLSSLEVPYDVVFFNEGDIIFKEGDQAAGLYLMKAGCVKIYVNRDSARGRTTSPEYVTKLLSPGEVFGYKALVLNQPTLDYAKAIKKTTVWVYKKEVVLKLLANMNPLMRSILDQSVLDLNSYEKTNQFHYLASVQERIAYQLVTLADRFGVKTDRGISLNLKLTRNEFAQLASTINESLSRHLTEFKNAGLIDLNGKEIIILNREALAEKSGNF
ncbi:MAG: Crp/Fnr family transcriptional regulator [Pseudobdellovibrio sp.]